MSRSPADQKHPKRGTSMGRRTVLNAGAAAASSLFLAPFIHARTRLRQEETAAVAPLPSRLKLAAIGAGNRAAANIAGVLSEDVAYLCDVDERLLQRGVDQVVAAGQPRPTTYVDWRDLLTNVADLDGVVISTPDHTHAAIARWALSRKLPVYCEKPLTRTVQEARELQELARTAGVATQMGTQIHAYENYRRVVEAIRSGAIGNILNVHVVCSKSWSGGVFQGGDSKPPEALNWDLWLGPTPERAYSAGVHPAHWRRFWAFGNGTVGDMAAHWIDLVHWALELQPPKTIEVEGPEPDADGTPEGMHVRWTHERKNGGPDVDVHWWDGSMKWPDAPLPDCHVFVGTKGRLVSTYNSMEVQLAEPSTEPWVPPAQTIAPSPGHYAEWLNRIKDPAAPAPLCEFDYSGPLTESILLATVAYRAGGKITWDASAMDAGPGTPYLQKEERDGWRS